MTDKQTTIDGCDVSGCEFFETKAQVMQCHIGALTQRCKGNHNCYYKQHKRSEAQCEGMFAAHTDLEMKYKAKEQECEELKQRLHQCWNVENSFVEQLDQLKAKNTQLKKCNERLLQAIIKDQAEIVQKNIDETNISLLRENMDLQRQLDQLKVENESHNNRLKKLHKTLTEIKEIAEEYQKNYLINNGVVLLCNRILQKISEVENEKI